MRGTIRNSGAAGSLGTAVCTPDPFCANMGVVTIQTPVRDAAVRRRTTAAGIVSLWSDRAGTGAFVAAVAEAAAAGGFALGILWYSRSRHDGAALARGLAEAAPALEVIGCSTAGEITPDGLQGGGALAVLLPAARFEVRVALLERIDRLGVEEIAERAAAARRALGAPAARSFALALMDGMTFAEEATAAALQRGLDDVELVGGSAGDGTRFATTEQLAGGRVHERATVLALLATSLPFRTFSDNNFVPTDTKLVVTRADVDRRVLHELDAEPAADAYAAALGVARDALDVSLFATRPLVLRIGGEYYCRSVRAMHPDGSLSLYCAIDVGLVLTLAKSEGMVRASSAMLDALETELGPPDCLLGFDCLHRRLDAEQRGVTARMEALLRERRFVGFNTYGEQYRSMHLNQTFTGVAFGAPPAAVADGGAP